MKTAICRKCNKRKSLEKFREEPRKKNGKHSYCRQCEVEYLQKTYPERRTAQLAYAKKYANRPGMRELLRKKSKTYYLNNLEKVRAYGRKYRKKYYYENRERIIKHHNDYAKKRRKTNPEFKILCNIRRRLCHLIRRKRSATSMELIGCDLKTFRSHIEKQFKGKMNWNNYGPKGWHLDHIKPFASFDLRNNSSLKKVCHYTNMQPLWWFENIRKGSSER